MKNNSMLNKFMEMKDNLNDTNLHMAGAMASILLAEREFAEEKEEKFEKTGDHIEDELQGAEDYMKMWIACTNPTRKAKLKMMAMQEIEHAEFFMQEAYETATSLEDKAMLESKKMWHDSLVARVR